MGRIFLFFVHVTCTRPRIHHLLLKAFSFCRGQFRDVMLLLHLPFLFEDRRRVLICYS